MSTILRALRRLEREKEAAEARARLRDEVVAPTVVSHRRVWPAWVAAGTGAVALGAALALYLLAPGSPPPTPDSTGSVAAAPTPITSRAPMGVAEPRQPIATPTTGLAKPAPPPPATGPSPIPDSRGPGPAVQPPDPTSSPIAVAAATTPESAGVIPAPAAKVPTAARAAPDRLPESAPVSEAPAFSAPREPARRDAAPPPAPAASMVRTAWPDFSVQRTVWHPRSDRRIAHVAMAPDGAVVELHEGDSLGSLRVEEITPSGVTFSQGDVTISRRVGAR